MFKEHFNTSALFLGQNRERHMQSTCGADVPHGHAPTRDTKTRKKRGKRNNGLIDLWLKRTT